MTASLPDHEPRSGTLRNWLASLTRERRELKRARAAADSELLRFRTPPPRLAWRTAELTAGSSRLGLARELRGLVEASDPRYLPGASPLDRGAVRVEADALLALADRLADLEVPVAPRGVLLLERLLLGTRGPLYGIEGAAALDVRLREIAARLTVAP
jgi:hypothetical protein